MQRRRNKKSLVKIKSNHCWFSSRKVESHEWIIIISKPKTNRTVLGREIKLRKSKQSN